MQGRGGLLFVATLGVKLISFRLGGCLCLYTDNNPSPLNIDSEYACYKRLVSLLLPTLTEYLRDSPGSGGHLPVALQVLVSQLLYSQCVLAYICSTSFT